MKKIQWVAFTFIIAIVIVRGFWPEEFTLDKYSVGLLFRLAIPLLAPFLKKAKWFGAEFDFKEIRGGRAGKEVIKILFMFRADLKQHLRQQHHRFANHRWHRGGADRSAGSRR